MTRRLVVVIVLTVVGTLLVAGLTTVLIARWQARETTESVLREQAESLAVTVSQLDPALPARQPAARTVLRALRRALRVDGVEFVRLAGDGNLTGVLPDGVQPTDLDAAALAAGDTVSGANGSLVYAAAPDVRRGSTVVVVVTQEATSGPREALPYFLVASLVTLVIGALVAVVLGRRLSRPVSAAADASRRIAAGELSTRLPAPAEREQDELADLTRSINTMAAGLERSRLLEQQFLLSVSHDLRTPLTSIRGYATAICDGTAPDARAAAEVILDGSRRLERLVADLLDLAHLDGRSLALELVDHDVRGDAEEAVRAVAATGAADGVTVRLAPGDPVIVRADPSRVRQLLANLLDNARKYARTRIDVHVRTVDGMAAVDVDDDGPGIPPEDQPYVFERLYVARHRPARAEVGSGLGLAIVRQLAEAMGGSVAVGSAPTGGARLEVRLPLAAAVTWRERAGGERDSRSPPASTGS